MKKPFLKKTKRPDLNKLLCLAIFLLFGTLNVWAQSRNLTGTVTDAATGEPLPGVTIVIQGATIGTVSDVNGTFALNVTSGNILSFSYVGYVKQEITITDQTSLQIALEEDAKLLDEVVVVAYGSVVKRKLTNAVTSVNVKPIEDLGGYTNIASALQGRTPGVYISNTSGLPGSTPSLSIRGSEAPLYVIDGIVQDAANFNRLNSQDIESISIMKDAASAAVYGALAGNGIVVVKTKNGTAGKTRINYTYDHQFTQPTNGKDNISSYELASTRNYLDKVYGYTPTFSEEALEAYRTGSDPVNYPNVNWKDEIMRKIAHSDRHSLTVDGGSEDTQFRLSLGYFNQGSLIKPIAGEEVFTYKTANIGVNVTHYFRSIGLRVGLDSKGSFIWKKGKSESEIMRRIKTIPMSKIYNPDGTYFAAPANTSYLYLHPGTGYDKTNEPLMNNRLNLDWDVYGVKGLKALFIGNYKTGNFNQKAWNNAYVPSYLADGTVMAASAKPSLSMKKTSYWTYEFNAGLQYENTFAQKHTLALSAFYNQTESYSEELNAARTDYLTSSVDQIFAGPEDTQTNGGASSERGRLGYVGILNYDYMGRYIIAASLRIDGSDNYSKGNKYGYFPSVSAGYVISDEPFIRTLAKRMNIDLFKVRASWGKTGIDGARFAYYSNWSMGAAEFDIAGSRAPKINTPGLISPDLTWYSTRSTNVGVDLALFNNRLGATFDYFVQNTIGYLRSPQDVYRTPLGTSLPTIMSDDEFRRAGSEITLRWRDAAGDFRYEFGANLSFYDEIWVSYNEDLATSSNPLISRAGKTLADGQRTWISSGLYQDVDELLNNPHALWTSTIKTGDIRYMDINGDGRIDTDGTYSGDRVFNSQPTKPIMQYGVDFNFWYKGFSLGGLIQGSGKNYRQVSSTEGMPIGYTRLQFAQDLDYWTPANTDARYPIPDTGSGLSNNGQSSSTFWSINCTYVRLKNLQIGYDFKHKLLKNLPWVSNATISLVGQNLITISKANDFHIDPEQAETTNYGYPITKTYSIVLNLGF